MTSSALIAWRALIAVALVLGFYLVSLGLIALSLGAIYNAIVGGSFSFFHALLYGALIIAIIFHALLPRDRFVPPGPRLDEADHPHFFAEIRRVAQATGQAMPVEVYTSNAVNAAVAERGGIMGIGSRRIMVIGLPLLQVLNVSQLRAVLAHEFGHFHRGDTRLGGWVYKTRSAIGRTVQHLGNVAPILVYPFLWYGILFLRVTHSISRNQELCADALAARTMGSESLRTGLRVVHGAALVYEDYWNDECMPLIEDGWRPPLMAGFSQYLSSKALADEIHTAVAEEMAIGESGPYDTHPALKERMHALKDIDAVVDMAASMVLAVDERPGIELLRQPEAIERQLIACVTGPEKAAALKDIAWHEVGKQVYEPGLCKQAAELRPYVRGITPATVPVSQSALAELGGRIIAASSGTVTTSMAGSELCGVALNSIAACLCGALIERGFRAEVVVGEPITLRSDTAELKPFVAIHALAAGELTMDAWRARCAALGIEAMDLGAPAAS